jgi:hypothetical protein
MMRLLLEFIKAPLDQGGYGALGSCLMAGGADYTYYEKFGYKLCPYTLYTIDKDVIDGPGFVDNSALKESGHELKAIEGDDELERISERDAEFLKGKVEGCETSNSVALVPTGFHHKR